MKFAFVIQLSIALAYPGYHKSPERSPEVELRDFKRAPSEVDNYQKGQTRLSDVQCTRVLANIRKTLEWSQRNILNDKSKPAQKVCNQFYDWADVYNKRCVFGCNDVGFFKDEWPQCLNDGLPRTFAAAPRKAWSQKLSHKVHYLPKVACNMLVDNPDDYPFPEVDMQRDFWGKFSKVPGSAAVDPSDSAGMELKDYNHLPK